MKRLIIYSLILSLLHGGKAFSQNLSVEASLSQDSIIIGQHIELRIEAKSEKNIEILPALFEDTIVDGIEILRIFDIDRTKSDAEFDRFTESFLVTSFDTGYYHISGLKYRFVENNDTSEIFTNELELFVRPFVLLDTIPVDTIYTGSGGVVLFGQDGFENELRRAIPDSVKRKLSADSLQIVQEQVKQQIFQIYTSHVMNNAGLTDRDKILQISEASSQLMFIVDRSGIKEKHIVAGSVDTVFVQEFESVNRGQALFTLYQIKDIDDALFSTPFTMEEFWYYFLQFLKKYWWLLLLLLLIIGSVIYYFKYYKKGEVPTFLKIKVQEPAHVIALRKLNNIKNEKIWKSGQHKEFHVQITEAVREYIENRFGVNALEMTSSEILEGTTSHIEDDNFARLKQILLLADSVKFAKAVPLQNENDLSLKNAFEFVESTKEIEEEEKVEKLEAQIEVKPDDTKINISNEDIDKDKNQIK